MARNAQLNLRVRPALKAKIEKLAKQDRRTLSAYVEKLLEDHVKSASKAGSSTKNRTSEKVLFR
jgi:hypothetical protein